MNATPLLIISEGCSIHHVVTLIQIVTSDFNSWSLKLQVVVWETTEK